MGRVDSVVSSIAAKIHKFRLNIIVHTSAN